MRGSKSLLNRLPDATHMFVHYDILLERVLIFCVLETPSNAGEALGNVNANIFHYGIHHFFNFNSDFVKLGSTKLIF